MNVLKEKALDLAAIAKEKLEDVADNMQRRDHLSTGAYRGREGEHQGPPKVESGYYSSGKMQGFGSDGRSFSSGGGGGGGGGYGNNCGGGGGGGGYGASGGSYSSGGDRFGSGNRYVDAYSHRESYDREDDRGDKWGARHEGDTRSDRYRDREEPSRQTGGYAVPGAPTWSSARSDAPPPAHAGAPKIESGAYSTGRMQGFGSDGRTFQPEPAGYDSRRSGDSSEMASQVTAIVGEVAVKGVELAGKGVAAALESVQSRVVGESPGNRILEGSDGRNSESWTHSRYDGGSHRGADSQPRWNEDRYRSGPRWNDRGHGAYRERGAYGDTRADRWAPPERRANDYTAGASAYGRDGAGGDGDDDDDGHGASAWTSQLKVEETSRASDADESPGGYSSGRLKTFKINDAAPRRPTRPHPTSLARPSGSAAGRPRPTSGQAAPFAPMSHGGQGANSSDEPNLFDLTDEPPTPAPAGSGTGFGSGFGGGGGFDSGFDSGFDNGFDNGFGASPEGGADPFASNSNAANAAFSASGFGDPTNGASGASLPFLDDAAPPGVGGAPPIGFAQDAFAPGREVDSAFGGGGQPPSMSLLDSPSVRGDAEELFALAAPSDLTRAAADALSSAGQSDLTMLGGIDLASPVKVPDAPNTGLAAASGPDQAPKPADPLMSMFEKSLGKMTLKDAPAPAAPASPKKMGEGASAKAMKAMGGGGSMPIGGGGGGVPMGGGGGMAMGGGGGTLMGSGGGMPFVGGGMAGVAGTAPVAPVARFCSSCGAPRGGGNFCSQCGARLA